MFTSNITNLQVRTVHKNDAPTGPRESGAFDARDFAEQLKNADVINQIALLDSLKNESQMRDVYARLIMNGADEDLKTKAFNSLQKMKNQGKTPEQVAQGIREDQKTNQKNTELANERQAILAQFQSSPSSSEREIAQEAIQAKEELKEGTQKVKKETRRKTAETRADVEFPKEESLHIQTNEKGEFTPESMIDLLSDLDGMSGIEQSNRGVLRRALFGGTDQKETIGEQQLKHALRGKSRQELDAIFQRIVGSGTLPWAANRDLPQNVSAPQAIRSRFDLVHAGRLAIEKFQTALISEANVMADISGILLGDRSARAWLRAVIEPSGKEKFNQFLSDPKNAEKFADVLKNSEVIKRDPSMLDTIVSTLLKIGIIVPLALLSKWVVGGYIEQGSLDIKKKWGVDVSLGNLTAKSGLGESGSVAGSLDLVGARLEANWNDPEMRISNRLAAVVESQDPKGASIALVEKVNTEATNSKAKDAIVSLGTQYMNAIEQLSALPDSPARKDAMAHNTMNYLARVEQANGAQLKGVFAGFTKTGWMLGLSGAMTDRSGNINNINTGAARLEGEALGRQKISLEEQNKILEIKGITSLDNGGYAFPDGTQVVPNADQKVIFHFEEISSPYGISYNVTPELVSKTSKTTSDVKTLQLGRTNTDAVDDYISPRSKEVAGLVKSLRQTHSTKMEQLSTLVSDEQYADAKKVMEDILRTSKNKTASGLLSYMQSIPAGQEATFFDDVLRLTSGSNVSRKLGEELAKGKDVTTQVEDLYEKWLAQSFGDIYGVGGDVIMSQFQKMKSSLGAQNIRTLGASFKDGFTGIVSYSQIDGKGKTTLKRADKIDNARAQMVGTPVEVTDTTLLNGVKNQLNARMTKADIEAYRAKMPQGIGNVSEAEIRALVIDGAIPQSLKAQGYTLKTPPKVYSYLSFESNAECFNMGFVITPVELQKTTTATAPEQWSTFSQGTVVGIPQGHILSFGLWVGGRWEAPKAPETVPGNTPGTPTPPPDAPPPVQPPTPTPDTPRPPVTPPVQPPVTPPPSAPITTPGVTPGTAVPPVTPTPTPVPTQPPAPSTWGR